MIGRLLILTLPIFGTILVATIAPSTANESQQISVEDVETPEASTGTIQDLEELPSPTGSDWFWQENNIVDNNNRELDSNLYRINDDSYQAQPSVDFLEEETEWKKNNHGDVDPPSASIDLTNF